MATRRIYDGERHVHFVTFSCYKRRVFLQQDRAKRIVLGSLGRQLAKADAICSGFVIMPNHVHALLWFPEPGCLSEFMNKWKDQSSHEIKKLYRTQFARYWETIDEEDPIWQPRYYDFNLWSRQKMEEKLNYMHMNPVRAGLVEQAGSWKWSSAAWYLYRKSVGLPIKWPPGLEEDDEFTVG